MNITPDTLKRIESDIQKCFADIEKTHGVKLQFGRGSYTPTNAKVSLEIATINETGEVQSRVAEDYKMFAQSLELDPNYLNKQFSTYSGTYTLRGYRSKARKNCFLAEKVGTGKMYVFPLEAIKYGFINAKQNTEEVKN